MLVNTNTTLLIPLRRIVIFALLLSAFSLTAQDIHFSQFGNSPLNLNPGLAGVFGGDLRFVGNFRKQWSTVPVPYTTFSGSVENKVYFNRARYNRFATTSLLVNYDRQGDLALQSLQIGIPLSVTLPVGRNNFFTFGLTPMFGQRSFDKTDITFGEQYIDGMFDPGSAISEDLSITTLNYFDLSAGANYRIQASRKRSRVDLGAAMHHINRPVHDFWASSVTDDDEVRLYNKLTLYGLGLVQLTERFDFLAQGLFQQQGKYSEIVYGAGVRMHLNKDRYKELSLQIGADWRHRYHNSLVPRVEVFYRTWTIGATFDWDAFSRAGELISDRRGGPELSVIYRFYKVKAMQKFKSCPII
ncbi:MAG: PorP/SprF family type IX secretion system membrane protein [Saprospiraceae bacterium]|nr:PorP/SprF family type IX secretion system membrane protein [Saprospiraceae bacterium]